MAIQGSITVLAAVDWKYAHYILPYMFSVLVNNENARVEIVAEDGSSSGKTIYDSIDNERLRNGLAKLQCLFPNRSVLKAVDMKGVHPSAFRFIHEPAEVTDFVYIGDVDILMLEAISEKHIALMKHFKTRYSNVVRKPEGEKLTGLHFSEYNFYYPVKIPEGENLQDQTWGFDEKLLFKVVAQKAKPNVDFNYRPLHGLHVSPHGWPSNRARGWGVQLEGYRTAYQRMRDSENWNVIRPFFDKRYEVMLGILDASIAAYDVFSEQEIAENFVIYGKDS